MTHDRVCICLLNFFFGLLPSVPSPLHNLTFIFQASYSKLKSQRIQGGQGRGSGSADISCLEVKAKSMWHENFFFGDGVFGSHGYLSSIVKLVEGEEGGKGERERDGERRSGRAGERR